MCLLIAGIRSHRNFPIYIAANREEDQKRKTTLPKIIDEGKILVAGIDEREGGAWLGVNHASILAAITNREEKGSAGKKRSRGQLVLEVLRQDTLEKIVPLLKKNAKFYKSFNLLYGNLNLAYLAVWNGKRLTVQKMDPGVHVITRGNADDRKIPNVRRAFELLEKQRSETAMPQDFLPTDWRDLFFQLIQVCKDHEPEKNQKETICRHDKPVKTVNSTIFALGNRGVQYSFFWHLTGNPCAGTYRDYTQMTRKVIIPQKAVSPQIA